MLNRALKLIISLVVAAYDYVSTVALRLFGAAPTPAGVVLYYHAVRAESRQKFAAQMDQLVRLTIPFDLEDGASPLPGQRYAAVTFDDAFLSVAENALPELEARRIPSMIFVPTDSIGGRPSWIGPSHVDAAETVMSAEQLRQIAQGSLVRIGSHSVSHPDFRKLNELQANAELSGSKATLEAITGMKVSSFSFPHGAHTQRCIELAAECGYSRVLTIEPVQIEHPCDAFAIGRVRVEPDDLPIEFRLKLLGAYRWMPRVSRLKRLMLEALRGKAGHAPPLRQEP